MNDISPNETQKKILEATERLIYAGGICATGMDLIVKTSGVARKSIYRYFLNKDELVAEVLRRRDERWMQWFTDETNRANTPTERLLSMFSVLEKWFVSADFRGCAFINAAGEIGDADDPIRAVAKEHKIKLLNFLRQLAEECRVEDPAELASELLVLVDGAITVALVTGNKESARSAQNVARKLLGL
ncbi:bacterial regulatory s, tetR family protein [Collimonas arenae]|uniref:Bacterial regulatory s, tetR family protein n=1 Tax=Collimonas arenae TaxID=279058 RepID=A0A127PWH4_9BURK|nr:TetR/AcrR family transcriptional regulator [Collimonas arenae]AMP02168.1 bacterial regulatory s, tetR family protein [Collimonas arenae]AMP12063.1 bacterial regulatory s, tetR family protein [Collimonas arenae]